MTPYIPILGITFATTLLISSYYWLVVRPILVTRIIYRLFERRDVLRKMAIKSEINLQSKDYQEIENFICKTLDFSSCITLGGFVWTSIVHRKEFKNMREPVSSNKKLVIMREGTSRDAIWLMSFNSPVMFGIIGTIAGVMWVLGRFNRMLVIKNAAAFVDHLPTPHHEMGLTIKSKLFC